mmetsp:Transcript_5106/g.6498  ORF Transcript_5106/g.6498 Transcript_5106/m.6498 type:complete len:82 (-) Transcript_5106:76-321(-)|eukprot:CAMPEP_0201489796 /NCGR_PEP_ID=MMETSP0151_2-20130828/23737_1 /ASSEMBLY_ACC=CAM_ASM_000257 /TAXON_ID=200890 /ORGANISM="Paramoeba atlantica, Strain 621/1 / CCAP 1560/9" /LENGTH=81 /DNA_ID=CAMNT_0047875491 /DNA_START=80 /DNA_END=325 /DNA_ORIENTATION=-
MVYEVLYPAAVMVGLLSAAGFGIRGLQNVGFDRPRPINQSPWGDAMIKRDRQIRLRRWERERGDEAGLLERLKMRDPYNTD